MIVRFACSRDRNGNRYYRIVDFEKKIYSKEVAHWFCKEDFLEVSKSDLHKLENWLDAAGFSETDKPL